MTKIEQEVPRIVSIQVKEEKTKPYIIIQTETYIFQGRVNVTFDNNRNTVFYWESENTRNDALFEYLRIKDKFQFQQIILGYSFKTGIFPNCKSPKDVITLVKALQYYNEI